MTLSDIEFRAYQSAKDKSAYIYGLKIRRDSLKKSLVKFRNELEEIEKLLDRIKEQN